MVMSRHSLDHVGFFMQPNRPTSVSDNADYRSVCARAARDDAAFARFRRLDEFLAIVEPPAVDTDGSREASYDATIDGREYAEHVRNIPSYRPLLDRFRVNDEIGAPLVETFDQLGRFNTYTLRYIKILWDLEQLFGNLDEFDILEVGGGYGGQCAILARRFAFASYDVLDLPETGELARRFLDAAGVDRVRCLSDPAALQPGYHLVISNYAFSELDDRVRADYWASLLPRCARGFMLWNRLYLDINLFKQSWDAAYANLSDEMRRLFSMVHNPRMVDELLTKDDRVRGNVMIAWG
jgi:hypothetical protein